MFIDSHCHLDFPGLEERLGEVLDNMAEAGVVHALCISVTLEDWPKVMAVARRSPRLSATVGVHPDYEDITEPTVAGLVEAARDPVVVAIGETGLDYYRIETDAPWQRERFATHIRAARQAGLPLVIHTRAAGEDTIRIMKDEGAGAAGGVMHCFTETWDIARRSLDLGFHLSFSGILTFKNAESLRDVARRAPLDRILIETDSPYLAPVPHRGKTNEPAWVVHVAHKLAEVRGVPVAAIAEATSANFHRLFAKAAGAVTAAADGQARTPMAE